MVPRCIISYNAILVLQPWRSFLVISRITPALNIHSWISKPYTEKCVSLADGVVDSYTYTGASLLMRRRVSQAMFLTVRNHNYTQQASTIQPVKVTIFHNGFRCGGWKETTLIDFLILVNTLCFVDDNTAAYSMEI